MKKLTNLILMSSVKMYEKKQKEEQQKQNNVSYHETIKNLKKQLNKCHNNEESTYNSIVRSYSYYKKRIRHLRKLQKLNKNSNNLVRSEYNIVRSKNLFERVVKTYSNDRKKKNKKVKENMNKKMKSEYNNNRKKMIKCKSQLIKHRKIILESE